MSTDSPAFAAHNFRDLVSTFASGVTIVTTYGKDDRAWGFTATAFSSVSLDPPLVLVCLDVRADCHAAFQEADSFAVSVLGDEQRELAARFAAKGTDKFVGVEVVPGERTPLPLVAGAHAHLECTVFARHPAGDHTILLGKVVGGRRFDRAPLLYYGRAFGSFSGK